MAATSKPSCGQQHGQVETCGPQHAILTLFGGDGKALAILSTASPSQTSNRSKMSKVKTPDQYLVPFDLVV